MRLFEFEDTPQARMDRARRLGFDISTRLYHGTNQVFDEFDLERLGDSTHHPSAKLGFFFTNSPASATEFADSAGWNTRAEASRREARIDIIRELSSKAQKDGDWVELEKLGAEWEEIELGADAMDPSLGQNIVPVYIKPGKQMVLNWGGANVGRGPDAMKLTLTDQIERAKTTGYDTVRITNVIDSYRKIVADQYVVFNPADIRSIHAKFDLNKAASSKLMDSEDDKNVFDIAAARKRRILRKYKFNQDAATHGMLEDSFFRILDNMDLRTVQRFKAHLNRHVDMLGDELALKVAPFVNELDLGVAIVEVTPSNNIRLGITYFWRPENFDDEEVIKAGKDLIFTQMFKMVERELKRFNNEN